MRSTTCAAVAALALVLALALAPAARAPGYVDVQGGTLVLTFDAGLTHASAGATSNAAPHGADAAASCVTPVLFGPADCTADVDGQGAVPDQYLRTRTWCIPAPPLWVWCESRMTQDDGSGPTTLVATCFVENYGWTANTVNERLRCGAVELGGASLAYGDLQAWGPPVYAPRVCLGYQLPGEPLQQACTPP